MATVPGAGPNPQAAIQKYATTTGADPAQSADAAIIARVEHSLQTGGLLGWIRGQQGEVDAKHASTASEVNEKHGEFQHEVQKNAKDAPPDAGAPPKPGQPAHPQVNAPTSAAGGKEGPTAPKGGTGEQGPKHAPPPKGGPGAGAKAAAPAGMPAALGAQLGGATNAAQLDGLLNGYAPKSPEPPAMLGRVKQMGSIAEGFSGSLDTYIAKGGAVEQTIATMSNALGVGKDVSAIWANNPYAKVHGILGNVMQGLSAIKSVCSIVGSICGKIGMVLTVVGLLGMIFPPIGTAVSGIARILNVVGMICDAIAFVLSAVLTGLNGVVLAKQIASGASAEEKAATADMMITEANDTASGFINMAMTFGPKFMKGLMGSSKGILASLMKQAKAVIGRVALKISGNVKAFATKIARKMGFAGVGAKRVGGEWKDVGKLAKAKDWANNTRLVKAFKSAPATLEKIQDNMMERYSKSDSAWAKGMRKAEKFGVTSGAFASKFDIEEKIGKAGESSGKWVGNLGANTKFGQSMAKSAERSELLTREAVMKEGMHDAQHLEQERWKRELKDRQRENPDHIRSPEAEKKFVDAQKEKVAAQHQAAFDQAEKKRLTADKLEQMKQGRVDRQSQEIRDNHGGVDGVSSRDRHMNTLEDSRKKRFELEDTKRAQDEERKELMKKTTRSAEEEARLGTLNTELKDLDWARKTNKLHEREMSGIASGGRPEKEVENWHDVATNVWDGASPVLEAIHAKNEDAWWKGAEKTNLKDPLKFDKRSAKSNAAGRGGHGIYGDIATEDRRSQQADFHNFVAAPTRNSSIGAQARSMLSSIARSAPPKAAAPKPTPAPAPTSVPKTPAPPSPVPVPFPNMAGGGGGGGGGGIGGGGSTAPTTSAPSSSSSSSSSSDSSPASPPTQSAPPPDTVNSAPPSQSSGGAPPPPAGGDTAEALPYWPALLPEFDKATHDFGYMRKVSVEFRKAQIDGKQKAVDTLAIYGRYNEYAKLRQDQAKAHQSASQATAKDAQGNASHANETNSSAGKGEQKQGEAKGAANDRAAVDLPEPESRGFWDRILGAIKRWAKNKAAQIFGWIQEKIASLILKGLCGVSMGDLRDYAGALRRQQGAASGVAQGADAKAGQAGQKQIKLSADASKEAQGAADSIGECDRNITEADQFMSDITSFEQQLQQEKAHAQAFIAQVHAAAHAEQARMKKEEDDRAKEEALAAQRAAQLASPPADDNASSNGDQNQSVDPGATQSAGPQMSVAPTPDAAGGNDAGPQQDDGGAGHDEEDHAVADAEAESKAGQLQSTADYVASSGDDLVTQLSTKAEDYRNQFAIALTNHTGKDASGDRVVRKNSFFSDPASRESKSIVDTFKEQVEKTKQDMKGFHNLASEIRSNPSNAQQIANTIIQAAEHLDSQFADSQQHLDSMFDRSYNAVRDGKRTLKSQVLDGDNAIGHLQQGGDDFNRKAWETVSPTANNVVDPVLTPFKQAPIDTTPGGSRVG